LSYMRHLATRSPIQFTSLHLGDQVHLLHLPAGGVRGVSTLRAATSPRQLRRHCELRRGGRLHPLEGSFAEGGYEPTQACAAPISERAMSDSEWVTTQQTANAPTRHAGKFKSYLINSDLLLRKYINYLAGALKIVAP
jgi:hypothetical protein